MKDVMMQHQAGAYANAMRKATHWIWWLVGLAMPYEGDGE